MVVYNQVNKFIQNCKVCTFLWDIWIIISRKETVDQTHTHVDDFTRWWERPTRSWRSPPRMVAIFVACLRRVHDGTTRATCLQTPGLRNFSLTCQWSGSSQSPTAKYRNRVSTIAQCTRPWPEQVSGCLSLSVCVFQHVAHRFQRTRG